MAIISKGIKLSYKGKSDTAFIELTNLQEIPELGGDKEALEITTLASEAHEYTDGLLNYGDSLPFKFLYEEVQFSALVELEGVVAWKVTLPGENGTEGATCSFNGTGSVKLDGVGTNAVLTYTLSIKPNSKMVWA